MAERGFAALAFDPSYTGESAAEPKELLIVPGASHVDLYDRTDVIPFDRLEAFFTRHLA